MRRDEYTIEMPHGRYWVFKLFDDAGWGVEHIQGAKHRPVGRFNTERKALEATVHHTMKLWEGA